MQMVNLTEQYNNSYDECINWEENVQCNNETKN